MAKSLEVGDLFSMGAKSREMKIEKIVGTIIKFESIDGSLRGKVDLKHFDRIYLNGDPYDSKTMEKLKEE